MQAIDELRAEEKILLPFVFRVSMWWRIVYGGMRLVLGFMLLRVVGTPFSDLFYHLMSHEVTEDPKDILFQFIYNTLSNHALTVTYFVAGYLIFWGIVDVFLSVCLLRHKAWAFPISIGLIALFVLFSIHRVLHTHSPILWCVIMVDLFIMLVIYREYRVFERVRRPAPAHEASSSSLTT